jgi:hypothetical protein
MVEAAASRGRSFRFESDAMVVRSAKAALSHLTFNTLPIILLSTGDPNYLQLRATAATKDFLSCWRCRVPVTPIPPSWA